MSVEDAELIARLSAAGEKVRVQLRTGGKTLKNARSHNVIAEIRGREKPVKIYTLTEPLRRPS